MLEIITPMKRAGVLLLSVSVIVLSACQDKAMNVSDTPSSPSETAEKMSAKNKASKPDFDKKAMDTLLASAITNGDVPGVSALVFDEGQIVYKGAFGLRDVERKSPVEIDSVFRIYSMTKPVTSALIMDLQEEGKLNVNDPVAKYIPELAGMKVATLGSDGTPVFTEQNPQMTIKDLLLHRAGMGYGIFGDMNAVESAYGKAGLFDPDEDLSVKMTKLSQLPLLAQPGATWYYSYSIDVLGRIAEVVTDQKLSKLFQDRFFDPLGMTETGFHVRPDQKARFASNYALTPEGTYVLEDDGQASEYLRERAFESGGGGLVSTLDDYAKFAELMLGKGMYRGTRILETATVEMMMTDHLGPDATSMFPWILGDTNAGFGYGGSVHIANDAAQIKASGKAIGQWGWSGAARTNFWIDPDSQAFGIIFLQFFSPEDPKLHADFQSLVHSQTRNSDPIYSNNDTK